MKLKRRRKNPTTKILQAKMSELHLFKAKRGFPLQVINIKNFLIRDSTKWYKSRPSKVRVPLSVIRSRVIKRKFFIAKNITFVKLLFLRMKRKNISTLIACDKLPVRTTPELHALGFEEDRQECNYLGDLAHWGNTAQKMQKIIKSMIRRKRLCNETRPTVSRPTACSRTVRATLNRIRLSIRNFNRSYLSIVVHF